MRGDLLFYKSRGVLHERMIAWATHGPYVHVAIVTDMNRVIAADARGIDYDRRPPLAQQHTILSLASYAAPAAIERAVQWAELQQGKRYGWLDIAYQAVKFLAPNNPFRFGEADHWDCSDFATRYLLHAGVQLPDAYSDPYANTPNDLARLFGVLPAKGIPTVSKEYEE